MKAPFIDYHDAVSWALTIVVVLLLVPQHACTGNDFLDQDTGVDSVAQHQYRNEKEEMTVGLVEDDDQQQQPQSRQLQQQPPGNDEDDECATKFITYNDCILTELNETIRTNCDGCRSRATNQLVFDDKTMILYQCPVVQQVYCDASITCENECDVCSEPFLEYWNCSMTQIASQTTLIPTDPCLLSDDCDDDTEVETEIVFDGILLEEACAVEYQRVVEGLTIREKYEPAHTCTCIAIPSSNDGQNNNTIPFDASAIQYEISCVSNCEICSLGRCTSSSSFVRQFTARRNTQSGEIETRRERQTHCATYSTPTQESVCSYSGSIFGLQVNNVFCDDLGRADCNDVQGGTRPFLNCTNVGGTVMNFCSSLSDLIEEDGLTNSSFTLVHPEFQSNVCVQDIVPTLSPAPTIAITAENACAIELYKTYGRDKGLKEGLAPAHTCTCYESPDDPSGTLFQIDCISQCDICSLGRCASSSNFTRIFTAERNDDGNDIETAPQSETVCVTYRPTMEDEDEVTACYHQGQRFDMSLNGEFCQNLGRRPCSDGSQRLFVDCTNVNDYILDFCWWNVEGIFEFQDANGIMVNRSQSAFVMAVPDWNRDTCAVTTTANSETTMIPTTLPETIPPNPSPVVVTTLDEPTTRGDVSGASSIMSGTLIVSLTLVLLAQLSTKI